MKKRDINDLIRIFESVNNVTLKTRDLLIEGVLLESRKTEEMSLKILNRRGVDDGEGVLERLKRIDGTNNQILLPVMAFFYDESYSNYYDVFKMLVRLINDRVIPNPQVRNDAIIFGDNWIDGWDKMVDYVKTKYDSRYRDKKEKEEDNGDEGGKLLFDKNGIKIYSANNQSECIIYTQRGLTGQKYTFCIGQYVNNMYGNYRTNYGSTFYFIVDSNRDFDSDPLHIVVVDSRSNGDIILTDADNDTGNISEYGDDVEGYIQYLEFKGVDTSRLFKNKPMTDREKELDKMFGEPNLNLEWFKGLSYDDKLNYIIRGHELSYVQFKYLWDERQGRGFNELLKRYLDLGKPVSSEVFHLMIKEKI